jgi:hypothetical protein
MKYKLNKIQLDKFADFLMDLAKISFTSAVAGYFMPGSSVGIGFFAIGFFLTIFFMSLSLNLLKAYEQYR